MIDDKMLEKIYKENLEESIISHMASECEMSMEKAMETYYNSKLAGKINKGEYGIQYLDYKVLAQILRETEVDLFAESLTGE